MIFKVLLCHLVSVNDLDHEIPSIDSAPLVNEFLDMFPEDLSRVPPLQEIYLGMKISHRQPFVPAMVTMSF